LETKGQLEEYCLFCRCRCRWLMHAVNTRAYMMIIQVIQVQIDM